MRQASLTCTYFGPPTWTPTTSLSQPRYALVSAHTITHVTQCSVGLMSRSCDHKRLLNRAPLNRATHCSLQLGKMLYIVDSRSQHNSTKNVAYQAIPLTSAATRAVYEKYRENQDGNLVTDIKCSLDLWRAHFNAILNGGDTNNSANEMIRPSGPSTLGNAT